MKVQFNTHIDDIPLSFNDIEHGFGLYLPEDMGSREFRFIEKFTRFFHKKLYKKNSENHEFIQQSAESIVHLTERYNTPVNFQVNVGNSSNKFLNLLSYLYSRFTLQSDKVNEQMENMFSNDKNFYYPHDKIGPLVVVSSGFDDLFSRHLVDTLGIKFNYDFVLFHEFGHHMEEIYANNECTDQLEQVIDTSTDLTNLFYDDLISPDYAYIKSDFLSNFSSLCTEVYADTASLLMLRNRMIENDQYDTNEFLHIVTQLHNARIKDNYEDPQQMEEILPSFSHFTQIVSDVWKEKIIDLEKSYLVLEDVNELCIYIRKVAAARAIYTLSHNNENYQTIFKDINQAAYNEEEQSFYIDKLNIAESLDTVVNEYVGKKWLEKFHQDISTLTPDKYLIKERAIFNLGTQQTQANGEPNIIETIGHQEMNNKQKTCNIIEQMREYNNSKKSFNL